MREILVGADADIAEGSVVVVETGGHEVGVLRIKGQLHAYENYCLHQGGPVCYGEVLGKQEVLLDDRKRVVGERFSEEEFHLICPWHGWCFDAETGVCVTDRRMHLRRFELTTRDGQVYVRVPEAAS